MNPLFDPVWPWDRVWAVFTVMPWTDFALLLCAALAAFVGPLLALWRSDVPRLWWSALVLLLVWGLVLLARYGSLWEAPVLALLLFGPAALAGLSLGSYLGAPRGATVRVTAGQTLIVFWLRALALFLVALAIVRPALAWEEPLEVRAVLWVALDGSRSMTIFDEEGSQTRWQRLGQLVREAGPASERLKRAGLDVRYFRFSNSVEDCTPEQLGEADGPGTDFGQMLRFLHESRSPAAPPRALLILSDGADNGTTVPALTEAERWRALPCPIHVLPLGKSSTSHRQNDVALTAITTSPTPSVPVRGKMNVRVSIDAHGFEGKKARLRLFLEAPDEQGTVTDRLAIDRLIHLPLQTGNEEEMTLDAPAVPCEARVRVTVETDEPDSLPLNNTIETFVTISQEGTSVLLVDRPRIEGVAIHDALVGDPRLRVTPVWVRGAGGSLPLDGQPYDAIILGDVSADQLAQIDPQAVQKLEKMVGAGAGLMMLGGYRTFHTGGWHKTPLANALPISLAEPDEQVEAATEIVPTEDGLRRARYLFDLDGGGDLKNVWAKLPKLEGYTELRLPKKAGSEVVLALANNKPLLVMGSYSSGKPGEQPDPKKGSSAGRVLVFGGDTTHRWARTEDDLPQFNRFWRRVAVWLAGQEEAEGGPWVRPDLRRIPIRTDLGFRCGLRAKGGGEIAGAKLEAEVITPAGDNIKLPLSRSRDETRGLFRAAQTPGIYRVLVRGEGTDPSGNVVKGEATSRVIVFDEDVELSRPAADPAFLKKLADAGGGKTVSNLEELFDELAERPVVAEEGRRILRPDWRTEERSWFLMAFLTLFCAVVCLEWTLRRWWGMV